ncbi:hypothetical protein D3C81_1534600 [compost metagenome]
MRLHDTSLRLCDAGHGSGKIGLRGLYIFEAGRFILMHLLLALMLLLAQAMLRPLLRQLRLQFILLRAAGIHRRLQYAGINLRQQLAFLHHVTRLHMQLQDLAGYLRTDFHRAHRLQGTDRRNRRFNIAARHRRHFKLGTAAAGGPQTDRGQCRHQDDQAYCFLFAGEALARIHYFLTSNVNVAVWRTSSYFLPSSVTEPFTRAVTSNR